jgi:hypothetical protein
MKKLIKYGILTILCIWIMIIINGCNMNITRAITIEYPPGSEDSLWVKALLSEDLPKYHPTIAINRFSDELGAGYTIGAIYNRSGKKVETLVADEKPTDIFEKALAGQLEKAGFTVIRTSSWDLNPQAIPDYLKTDIILGGRLKEFSVESRAGFLTSTIDSKVAYDLVIADAHNKKMIWTGQTSGYNTKKSLVHTSNFFWTDLQISINKSLIQAVNNALQDEQTLKTIRTLFPMP